jgi:predicted PurR-regulated permease PerM
MKHSGYDHYLSYVPGVRFWVIATGIIVTFAAIKQMSHIVNILLLAAFLTAISLAPLEWLRRKGVSKIVANIIIIISVVIVVWLLGVLVNAAVHSFMNKLPSYQDKFQSFWNNAVAHLADYGLIDKSTGTGVEFFHGKVLTIMAPVASGFGSVLSGIVIVFIFFIFLITESEQFTKKLAYVSRDSSKQATQVIRQLRNYFGIKTLTSLSTGILVAVALYIIGVDFVVLWGFLAFILNYIPSIGSFIAAIPAVLLAFIIKGPTAGIITILVYLVINTLIGNVVEPQLMGRNLGLSPFIVFFSMIFFGFILGPVGMLIATPLTIIIKIILDSREVTRGLGIMLGDGKELKDIEVEEEN